LLPLNILFVSFLNSLRKRGQGFEVLRIQVIYSNDFSRDFIIPPTSKILLLHDINNESPVTSNFDMALRKLALLEFFYHNPKPNKMLFDVNYR
jgi:hypothetical protein